MLGGRGLNSCFRSPLCAKLEREIDFEAHVKWVNEGPAIQEKCAMSKPSSQKIWEQVVVGEMHLLLNDG
jgi:hypothetical protein